MFLYAKFWVQRRAITMLGSSSLNLQRKLRTDLFALSWHRVCLGIVSDWPCAAD
jgi:hypothetical protein